MSPPPPSSSLVDTLGSPQRVRPLPEMRGDTSLLYTSSCSSSRLHQTGRAPADSVTGNNGLGCENQALIVISFINSLLWIVLVRSRLWCPRLACHLLYRPSCHQIVFILSRLPRQSWNPRSEPMPSPKFFPPSFLPSLPPSSCLPPFSLLSSFPLPPLPSPHLAFVRISSSDCPCTFFM